MATRRSFLAATATATAGAAAATLAHPVAAAAHGGGRRGRILIRGGHVITCDPQLGELPNSDVLIDRGRITAVGAGLNGRGAQVIDARGMYVAPGMVDNHRHLWGSLLRANDANVTFGQYLATTLVEVSAKFTPEDVYLGGLLGALEAINTGVTTVLDWNHACLTPAHARWAIRALAVSRIRGLFGYASPGSIRTFDAPPTRADVEAAAGHLADHSDGRLGLAIATRSPASVGRDPAGIDRIVADIEFARELGVLATLHIGFDTADDMRLIDERVGLGDDLNLLHPNSLGTEGLALVADRGGWLSISPEVELQMEFPPPQLSPVLDAGLPPTVSLDGPSIVAGTLQAQLRTMVQFQRVLDRINGQTPPLLLSPTLADTLPYVTANAAASLGIDAGVLAPGRFGDVVLVDRSDPTLAGADPTTAYAALTHPGAVDTVLIGGEIVKRRGKLVGHDLDELRRRVERARQRLLPVS